jgi:SulP family sulfate permease
MGRIGGKHRSIGAVARVQPISSQPYSAAAQPQGIARTAANGRNGGRTPVAGIVHSLTVLAVMMLFMPYAKMIPMSTLAAILMVVAYNMSEWRAFKNLFKAPKTDILVLLLTFSLTVIIDLVVAIEFGIVLAALLFMKRMADLTSMESMKEELTESPEIGLDNPEGIDPSIQIFQMRGPFFSALPTNLQAGSVLSSPPVYDHSHEHVPFMVQQASCAV